MATAFVLLNAELGAETEVLNGLKMIDEFKETHLIYGGLRYHRPDRGGIHG
jgi:hypothetical protein